MNYYDYLKSDQWKAKAQAAKVRAGNRCQVCNCEENLDTHHRTYERLGYEAEGDLIVLCHSCHEKFHFTAVEFTDEPLPPVIIFHGKSDSAWGQA